MIVYRVLQELILCATIILGEACPFTLVDRCLDGVILKYLQADTFFCDLTPEREFM